MNPRRYADTPRSDWDAVCNASEDAWLFHLHAWVDIETRYFAKENHSFSLFSGDRCLAVQPLYFSDGKNGTNGERLLHSGIHRHTGLAVRSDSPPEEIKSAVSVAMRHVMEIGDSLDVDRVQLNAHNLAPRNCGPERQEIPFWVTGWGFEPGLAFGQTGMQPAPGMATCNADQIVSLDADESALFARLHPACRRAVRKAEAAGLGMFECDADSVSAYYRLARLSAARSGEVLASPDYYQDIWEAFGDSGRSRILFARQQEVDVAAVLLLIEKGSASALAGVSDPAYLPVRVNDFLHWSAICWCKMNGLRRYRLGPTFPTVPSDWPIARVSRFKGKFGGRATTVLQGSFFRRPKRYRSAGTRLLRKACAATASK